MIEDNIAPIVEADNDFDYAAALIVAHAVDSITIGEIVSEKVETELGRSGPLSDNDYDWFDCQTKVFEELMDLAKSQLRGIHASAADDTAVGH